MLEFNEKGKQSIALGNKNEAGNIQYYSDAVNHCYEAIHWANRIVPKEEDYVPTIGAQRSQDIDPFFILGDKVQKVRLNG